MPPGCEITATTSAPSSARSRADLRCAAAAGWSWCGRLMVTARQAMDELLAGVQRHQASVALIDIIGVAVMDMAVADGLLRTAQAVRLLRAEVILVCIRPEVAQTVVARR